jgi:short-subunit dehydrogenase
VILTGRNVSQLTPLAEELDGEFYECDLAKPEAAAELAERYRGIDILICNAALPGSGYLDSYPIEEIDHVLDVNLRAPIVLSKILSESMVEKGSGHIVFISSMAGKVANTSSSLYSATKFGLRGFAFSLHEDLLPYGVGASVVSPGFVRDAGMFHDTKLQKLPPGVGTSSPEDVCNAVIKGIEENKLEVCVAPALVRFGGVVAGVSPSLIGFFQRQAGARKVSESIAAGQTEKR